MRVFLTGATGFIGSAIVHELLGAGHTVLGLARSDAKADQLTVLGVSVHRGDLTDVETIVAGARESDGVIHTAYIHDFSSVEAFLANAAVDLKVVEAVAAALEGTGKPFVSTSGTALLTPGVLGTEADAPENPYGPRSTSEGAILAASARGVRGSVVRLPPTVHGAGDHGFVPVLIEMARKSGVSAYVGDGANRWPAVHRLDAAHLFRLALESAQPGVRLHGVAEEGVPFRAIAETIGAGLGVPVRSLTPEEAGAHFGWFSRFAMIDNPVSSAITQATLGWSAKGPELLTDLRENGYFR